MSFLSTACAAARERVATAAEAEPLADLRARALARPAPPSLSAALATDGVAIIAEVKRASPSRGDLAPIPDAAALAMAYQGGGAAAVSVLTEPRWFRGSLHDLAAAADAVRVPVLRKDFVVDAYQAWEARAAGAAAVLLIVAALSDGALRTLLGHVARAGLEPLVEVHNAAEAKRAAAALAAVGGDRPVVGINARDLATLTVDGSRFGEVRAGLPDDALAVAESGVRGPEDVARYGRLGADAVLVGEHVATAADPQAAVRALAGVGVSR